MRKWRKGATLPIVLFITAIVIFLFASSGAVAKEKPIKQKKNANKISKQNIELETITVTAEKREENIQDVPVSVTALSGIQIEDTGVETIEELTAYIPNMIIHQFGPRGVHMLPFIRGIGATNRGEPALAFFVDGVSYLDGSAFNTGDLFDIERVEVLRGPQGTLYGRNALGGVVNIITKKPTNDFYSWSRFSLGDYSSWKISAGLNAPIIKDQLFLNISGFYSKRDGYTENDLSGESVDTRQGYSGRVKLRWLPTDALDVTLALNHNDASDGSYATGPLSEVRENPYHVHHDYKGDAYSDADQTQENLSIVYEAPWFTVTSITGLMQTSLDSQGDMDSTPNDYFLAHYLNEDDQFTQEFRFSSNENQDKPYKWLVGVYLSDYTRERKSDDNYRPDFYNLAAAGALTAMGLQIDSHTIHNINLDNQSAAIFGQATYTFFDKLDITAGLRYAYEDKSADTTMTQSSDISGWGASMLPVYLADPVAGPMLAPYVYSGPVADIDDNQDYTELLPKFSMAYHLDEQVMAYASVSKGFRSGGFNADMLGFSSSSDFKYGPEYSWNYEMGVKSSLLNGKLIANAGVFYIDYKDQQVFQFSGAHQLITQNAGETTSKGFEVELNAKPVQGLELTANYSYTDAEFDVFSVPDMDYAGNKIPYVPQYDYLLAAQYRHPLSASTTLFGRIEVHGVGSFFWDHANTTEQEAYQTFNARIGAEFKHFDIYLWGKNLFEEEYEDMAFEYPYLGWFGQSGDPRTIGITLTGRF